MELRENRTELERLLGGVWDYEDPGRKKTSLLKWLFALTLTGAVICTFSPPAMVASVIAALAPAPQKLSIDRVSSENVWMTSAGGTSESSATTTTAATAARVRRSSQRA